jgi:histidinol phosphate phosphatase HisJ family
MITDLHVHTEMSCDSQAKIYDYIEIAKSRKVNVVCFTDHVDFNINDEGYHYYNPAKFFDSYNQFCRNSDSDVELYAGIEFSEPHLYYDQLEELKKFPYDYIIGSLHWVGNMFPCQKVREQYTAKEFYELYWREMYNCVKKGGFDCLGHMDFPKRYYGELYYKEKMIEELFQIMLEKNIILEINTSSLRKGLSVTMPGDELLAIYKDCGGSYITIGSDSHEAEDLAKNNDIAQKLADLYELKNVIFKERKMLIV